MNDRAPATAVTPDPGTATARLRERMAALHEGGPQPTDIVTSVHEAELLMPVLGEEALWSGDFEGVRWLYAFTSESELLAFAEAKGDGGASDVPYRRILGERLLSGLLPGLVRRDGVLFGVAVDVTSEQRLLLPPVSGIVPDEIAVDTALERLAGQGERG